MGHAVVTHRTFSEGYEKYKRDERNARKPTSIEQDQSQSLENIARKHREGEIKGPNKPSGGPELFENRNHLQEVRKLPKGDGQCEQEHQNGSQQGHVHQAVIKKAPKMWPEFFSKESYQSGEQADQEKQGVGQPNIAAGFPFLLDNIARQLIKKGSKRPVVWNKNIIQFGIVKEKSRRVVSAVFVQVNGVFVNQE